MRARSSARVAIDLISADELGDVARIAYKLGYRLMVDNAGPDDLETDQAVARLDRDGWTWLEDEIAALVYIRALTDNVTPQTILERTRHRLEQVELAPDQSPRNHP